MKDVDEAEEESVAVMVVDRDSINIGGATKYFFSFSKIRIYSTREALLASCRTF